MFLELQKPLAYVGANAALVFAPFTVPFLGFDFVNNYSRLFARRENVERLICESLKGAPSGKAPKDE